MMEIIETELSEVSKGLAIVGWFIVFYGLVSLFVKERLFLSEPLLAVTVGCVVVPRSTDAQHHRRTACAQLDRPVLVGRHRDAGRKCVRRRCLC